MTYLRRMPLGVRENTPDEQRRLAAAVYAGERLMAQGAITTLLTSPRQHGPEQRPAEVSA